MTASLLVCTAFAQDVLEFRNLPAGDNAPSPRFDAPIAYDPAGRQLLMFGGQDNNNTRNDLWSYSLDRLAWVELAPSGVKPPARFGHTLIFDPVRRRVIAFGGQAAGFFSDTWAYDIAGNRWEQLAGDNAGPSKRYGHSAIYDPARDRMVISHGFTDSGRFDDTWAFQLSGNRWQNISPSSGRPLRRCLHHAVLDASANQMLLYGGCASGAGPCPLDDLWAFDLTAHRWTERTASPRPSGRQWFGHTFDSRLNRMIVFGGSGAGSLNDIWLYDYGANRWTSINPDGDRPSGRSRHEAAFASDLGASFFFGGRAPGVTNELWMLGGKGLASAAPVITGIVNAFSGDSSSVSPGEIVSVFGENLGPETAAAGQFTNQGELPRSLGGTELLVNGLAAPLYFAQAGQVNAQIPYELRGPEAAISLRRAGNTSMPQMKSVTRVHPGLLPSAFHPGGERVTRERPARAGGVIVLFATGYGLTQPTSSLAPPVDPVQLEIGGSAAEVLFAGEAPGTVGVLQVNARIPSTVVTGAVVLRIGDVSSNAIVIAIE